MNLINIINDNYINDEEVLSVFNANDIDFSKIFNKSIVIDITHERKVLSVIVLKGNIVILSPIRSDTFVKNKIS